MKQVNLYLDDLVNARLESMANTTHRSKAGMVSWLVDQEWLAMDGGNVFMVDMDSLPKEEQTEEVVIE